ncbi:AMP-binding protein, partial [Nocardia tengchongensis]
GAALSQLLTTAAEDDPDGPALVWGDDALTYQELDARSSRLARVLIARGSGPGTGVVLRLDRGVDQVVAVWAVLKAGTMLVPFAAAETPGHDVKVGITVGAAPEGVRGIDWLVLDEPETAAVVAAESARPVTYANRIRALRGDDLARVSADGAITYDDLAHAVDRARGLDLTFESRTFHHGAADSALAMVEVVAAGAVGASVVLVPAEPGAELSDALADEWVTHVFAAADRLGELDPAPLEDLRAVLLDAPTAAAEPWAQAATVAVLPE